MANNTAKVGPLTAISLVIASMIGTGIFTSLGFQVVDLKMGFSIISLWVLGGIVAFCGATTYAELGSAFPRSGGEYNLLSKIYHPALGFVAGWISATVGFATPAALAAIALSSYLSQLIVLPEKHVAAGVVLFFSLLHANTLRWGARFQDVSTLLKVALMVFLIIAGFLVSDPQNVSLLPTMNGFKELASGPFAVSLVYVSYAYTGWNSSIYIINDIREPGKNLSKSLFIGTGIVMILYVLINYIFLYTVPISVLAGKIEVGFLAGQGIFGDGGAKIIAAIICILLLSTVSAYVFVGPRIIQVMGEDIKSLYWFSKKNNSGIPQNAFLFSTMLSLLFIYTSTFEQVLIYTSFLLILITTITVAGVFVLRLRHPGSSNYKTWGYPMTPIVFLVVSVWTLLYLLIDKTFESLIAIGILGVGLGIYFLVRGGRHQLR